MADKPMRPNLGKSRSWLMGDSLRREREFSETSGRRDESASKPAKRPEQLFDEIEIEDDDR